MTQDEIISMAREAGLAEVVYGEENGYTTLETKFNPKKIADFAALVAAHEREKQAEQEPVAFQMKLYCSCCDKVQPVFVGDCKDAKTNESYQDIVCAECFLVIASGTGIPAEQAEQEPVAWYSDKGGFNECGEGQPLYAAPVRTKDLTDDEIEEIGKSYFDEWSFGFARAIIAADREKNK